MPSKTDTTDTRPEAQLQARLDAKLAAGLGLMALAVLVGSK